MITVQRVSRTFDHRRVLDQVSLTAPDAAVTAVVGPRSAGASTLLRIAAGALRPDAGMVTFDGYRLGHGDDTWRTLGAFLGAELVPGRLAVKSYLAHVRTVTRQPKSRFGELLDAAGLTHVPDQRIDDLAEDERQRLGIVAATSASPRNLVLDEPLAHLGADDVAWIRDLLTAHTEAGGSVLISSQSLDAVALLADRVVELDRGVVVREGPLASFLAPGSPRTFLRTDHTESAVSLLTEHGWRVEEFDDGLVVEGAGPYEVGSLLFAAGPGATELRALRRAGDADAGGQVIHPAEADRAVRAARSLRRTRSGA